METIKNIKNILMIIVISTIILISMSIQSLANNIATVKVETANLRQKASADSKILEQVSLNETVEVIEKSGEWYKVKYKSIEGYLRQDLITVNEDEKNTESENDKDDLQEQTSTETVATPEQQTSDSQLEENTITENIQEQIQKDDEKKLGVYKVKEDITIKIIPLIQASDIEILKLNQNVDVVDIKNNWAYISSDNKQGWVILDKIEYVESNTESTNKQEKNNNEEVEKENNADTSTDDNSNNENNNQKAEVTINKTQYVSSSAVNLRKDPNTSSEVLTSLTQNTQVTVIEEVNGWSKVEVNGKQGYISTQLLSDKKQETSRGTDSVRKTVENSSKEEVNSANKTDDSGLETNTSSSKGEDVVAYAKQYLGYKYVYGGTTPSGFDCSGFTQYVYKHFGVSINRTAAAQYANGTAVTNLQTGDLVMFGKSGINHVGIYISGGTFIHAANPSRGVTTDTLLSGYYKTNYVGARRIFN